MDRTIILSGKRIALATMAEADQPFFLEWLQEPVLRELIDDPRIPTPESQQAWFQRVQQPDRAFFSLVTVPEGVLIGNGGLVDINREKGEAVLRITIGNSDFLGQGLGSEAVTLLCAYAFESMKLKRVLLHVLESNARAVRSYEKAGFSLVTKDLQNGKQMLTMSRTNPAHS